MAIGIPGKSGPLADINVTPLVDVMLVLLIIFIVTAPIVARPITVDLPQRSDPPPRLVEPPAPIELRLDAGGSLYWNGAALASSDLQARLLQAAAVEPTNSPELRIDASPLTDYQAMASVLAAAKNADLQRITFVQR